MPALLRSQTTLAALAIFAILGLILAFHQVVRGAVARGELLQQARNLQGEAFSRCSSLRSFAARDNCMRQAQLKGSAELSQ